MKEEIQLLLDEAKNGIVTISDFYSDEIFMYFYVGNFVGITVTLIIILLIFMGLFIGKYKSGEFWYHHRDSSFEDGIRTKFDWSEGAIVFSIAGYGISFITFLFTLGYSYNLILLSYAPKIYITKELIDFF